MRPTGHALEDERLAFVLAKGDNPLDFLAVEHPSLRRGQRSAGRNLSRFS
jgi:hypothetical protein